MKDLKKIDLHLHLDGSIRLKTAWELLKERKSDLPVSSYEQCVDYMQVGEDCTNLLEFFKAFTIPGIILHDSESLERITYELVQTLAEQNVVYAEIRYAPQLHTKQDLTQETAIIAVSAGCKRASEDFPNIKVNQILCAMAFETADQNMKENFETVELVKQFLGKGVVALDLAGAEGLVPISDYRAIFDKANELGVPFTVHAGESAGPENVTEVLNWGTRRIGHGGRSIESDSVVQRLVDTQTPLELCVTSNVQTRSMPSYEQHSIRRLMDAGVCVTVNTDNMTASNTTLEREYQLLMERAKFTEAEIKQTIVNSANAAFLSDEDKKKILQQL